MVAAAAMTTPSQMSLYSGQAVSSLQLHTHAMTMVKVADGSFRLKLLLTQGGTTQPAAAACLRGKRAGVRLLFASCSKVRSKHFTCFCRENVILQPTCDFHRASGHSLTGPTVTCCPRL